MPELKKTTANWIAGSRYDIETAKHMYKTGRYIYVIFMCHLAIEKLLKAVVAESQEKHPPFTHDLYDLIERAGLEIPAKHRRIIAQLNELSIATRYPEDFAAMLKDFPKKVSLDYLKQSEEFLKWLERDLRLIPS
ncbi:MAG: HEPN domain-containing protein [Chloroflexi bacterium]|nr:HEPN domain-containing protein [Chloroflexota bacterium]